MYKTSLSFRYASAQGMWVPEAYTTHTAPQRNLNNAFAYDLVPSPTVIVAALKAARRVNDFPTAVRIFEGASSPSPSLSYKAGLLGSKRRWHRFL